MEIVLKTNHVGPMSKDLAAMNSNIVGAEGMQIISRLRMSAYRGVNQT